MKILVISLLRLGDAIMHLKLIDEIRRAHSNAQVDMLVNSEASHIKAISHNIDEVLTFPRKELQRSLANSNECFFNSYDRLKTWVSEINNRNYDMIYDFTNTVLSHNLYSLLATRLSKKDSLASYLNTVFSISKRTSFHYIDAVRNSHASTLKPQELATAELRTNKMISVQPLTSDKKKNWGIGYYQSLIKNLEIEFPDYKIAILGSPFEENVLRSHFSESKNVKIEVLDLVNLEFHLWESDLLITGDTAVAHLAAQCKTPMLAIYCGSADPYKTSPYLKNVYVVHSEEICAPCGHSTDCTQPRHMCSESIRQEDICFIVSYFLKYKIWPDKQFAFHSYLTDSSETKQFLLRDIHDEYASFKNKSRQIYWQQNEVSSIPKISNKFFFELQNTIENIDSALNIVAEFESELSNQLTADSSHSLMSKISEFERYVDDYDLVSLLKNSLKLHTKSDYFQSESDLDLLSKILKNKRMLYQYYCKQLRERGFVDVSGSRELS